MVEATINGQTYQLGKLDAMKQLHITRRIAPLLAQLTALAKSAQTPDGTPSMSNLFSLDMALLQPLALAFAALPDADVEYVIGTCMNVVSRRIENGTGWAKVMAPNNVLMYADIDMSVLISLVIQVVWSNLQSFIPATNLTSQAIVAKTP